MCNVDDPSQVKLFYCAHNEGTTADAPLYDVGSNVTAHLSSR